MTTWRKSSFSGQAGSCVELASDTEHVLVRNSNHPERRTLVLPTVAVAAFVAACQAGELDDLGP